jgi:hypothetical protein
MPVGDQDVLERKSQVSEATYLQDMLVQEEHKNAVEAGVAVRQ